MSRKPTETSTPLSVERLRELVEVLADATYALGPQDEQDIAEALREFLELRNAEGGQEAPQRSAA